MAKIIQFPKEKMKTPPQSKKELDAELLNNKVAYVDDVANHYSSSVFNKLAMMVTVGSHGSGTPVVVRFTK